MLIHLMVPKLLGNYSVACWFSNDGSVSLWENAKNFRSIENVLIIIKRFGRISFLWKFGGTFAEWIAHVYMIYANTLSFSKRIIIELAENSETCE